MRDGAVRCVGDINVRGIGPASGGAKAVGADGLSGVTCCAVKASGEAGDGLPGEKSAIVGKVQYVSSENTSSLVSLCW